MQTQGCLKVKMYDANYFILMVAIIKIQIRVHFACLANHKFSRSSVADILK
jgi:hypothetical protein